MWEISSSSDLKKNRELFSLKRGRRETLYIKAHAVNQFLVKQYISGIKTKELCEVHNKAHKDFTGKHAVFNHINYGVD